MKHKRWENHNFLIRLPRTFLHLSTQKEARGVSIKVNLKPIEMEYGNGSKSKYTTLYINTTVDWKRWTKSKKKDTDVNPPREDGEWARKSLFRIIFITSGYNIIKLIWCLLILIQNETKSLQSAKIKDFNQKGDPWGDSKGPKVTFEQQLILFSVILAKNQQAY